MSKMFAPKIVKSHIFFFTIANVGDVFDVFLFISMHILLVQFSPGSAVTNIG